MPKVSSLGHVGLLVHDIERSKAFYRDVLGLTVSDESETGTVFMTAQERDQEHHELQLRPGREGSESIVTQLSFRCGTLAELKAFHRDFRRTRHLHPARQQPRQRHRHLFQRPRWQHGGSLLAHRQSTGRSRSASPSTSLPPTRISWRT